MIYFIILGMPMRKSRHETASKICFDENYIHVAKDEDGYFLTILKFCAYFSKDTGLLKYLQGIQHGIEETTYVSKHFVSKLMGATKNCLIDSIKYTVQSESNGRFCVMVDTSTDVSIKQQFSMIIRYVTNNLTTHERVISFKSIKDTTGIKLYEHLVKSIADFGLSVRNVAAICTDGASNMSSLYNSLTAHLKKQNKYLFTIWCAAHRFNLIIDDAIKNCNEVQMLLSSINSFSSFIRRSPKRMDDYKKIISTLSAKYKDIDRRIRPRLYNSTRWWSKLSTINMIIKTTSHMVLFLVYLSNVYFLRKKRGLGLKEKQKEQLKNLYNEWTKDRRNIILSFSLRVILQKMQDVLSKLQTNSLPIYELQPLIESSYRFIEDVYNNKDGQLTNLIENAVKFSDSVYLRLLSPEIRSLFLNIDEFSTDITDTQKEAIQQILQQFTKLVYNGIQNRFLNNFHKFKVYYSEIQALNPLRIMQAEKDTNLRFRNLCKYNGLDKSKTLAEFSSFTEEFKRIANEAGVKTDQEDAEKQLWIILKTFFTSETSQQRYSNIHIMYKYIFILPCTQVPCERSFSIMGHIKSSHRSMLTDFFLEAYMMITSAKDLLHSTIIPKIIDEVGNSSAFLRKKLLYPADRMKMN